MTNSEGETPSAHSNLEKALSVQTYTFRGNAFSLHWCGWGVNIITGVTILISYEIENDFTWLRLSECCHLTELPAQNQQAMGVLKLEQNQERLLQSWHFYLGPSTFQASQSTEESLR